MVEERLREDSSVPELLEVKVPSASKDGEVIKFEIKTMVGRLISSLLSLSVLELFLV